MKLSTLWNLGKCVFILYTIYDCKGNSKEHNLTFLPEFQELCPYTAFCGKSSRLTLPKHETKVPCCQECSCEPECELFGNCCFDYVSNRSTANLRQCLSPVVTEVQANVMKYIMIYSCPSEGESNVLFPYTTTNISSFAPVVSIATGEIYVNQQCAECNDVTDGVPWTLSAKCPSSVGDFFMASSDILLVDKHVNIPECYLAYDPPDQVNVKSRECYSNPVRECNVTGVATQRTPIWEYCPMFNSTYTHSISLEHGIYGNIFCFICNHIRMPELLCRKFDFKGPNYRPFSALLQDIRVDNSDVEELNVDGCDSSSVMVHSLKSECRQVMCPMGQFRIRDLCGYYSNRWVGGSFNVLLKLTPLLDTPKVEVAFVLRPEVMNDTKASWLKRTSMKTWNFETLYKPTVRGKSVEYFVVLASYPYKSVNPTRLNATIRRALKEVWFVEINSIPSRFKVDWNRYRKYQHISRESLRSYNIVIDQPYGYILELLIVEETAEVIQTQVMYDVSMRKGLDNLKYVWLLNKLFFCKQIELNDDEYELGTHTIFFKVTNITLYASDYILTKTASVRVCLNQFPSNSGQLTQLYNWYFFLSLVPIIVNFIWQV